MNQPLFESLLNTLQPATLAAILLDLEEAAEDWQRYPEEAPAETDQRALIELQTAIGHLARRRAVVESLDFDDLLAQLRADRDDPGWLDARNRQTRENWFSDYE